MILKFRTWQEWRDHACAWHSWFAWHPVWGDGFIVWLRPVWRRFKFGYASCGWDYSLEKPSEIESGGEG